MRPVEHLGRTIAVALAAAGAVLAGPYAWARATHRLTRGHVLEVLPTPLPDGTVRLDLLFDVELPLRHGVEHALGYRHGDARCRPQEALIVPAHEASMWIARLRPIGDRVLPGQVLYRANDPSGSAFILYAGDAAMRRFGAGLVLLLLSLVVTLRLARIRR